MGRFLPLRSVGDLRQLAGLLEGEASFHLHRHKYPRIDLRMTDRDVVEWAANLLGTKLRLYPNSSGNPKHLPVWSTQVDGARAAGWMMTLYKHLGDRRRAKVREILSVWRAPR